MDKIHGLKNYRRTGNRGRGCRKHDKLHSVALKHIVCVLQQKQHLTCSKSLIYDRYNDKYFIYYVLFYSHLYYAK